MTPQKAAEMILEGYKIESESAIPIVKIVKDAGFTVFATKMDSKIYGLIIMNDESKERFGSDKVIIVNNNNTFKRKRFTIAHEFGHFLLDENSRNNYKYYNEYEKDGVENETEQKVNHFAAELLTPSKKFKEVWDSEKEKIKDGYELINSISEIFQVPPKSVEKHKRELGLD